MQSQPTTLLCRYSYDPLDRLASHTPLDTSEHQRYYCKSRLTTEIQGATRHSFVQYGDQLLAQQKSATNVPVTTLLATDQQCSVLHTLEANLPRQPIAYSPYGHRPIASGLLSLLGFNGERADPVTGHYLLGHGYRAFNPVLMRFNSPDNLSPFDRGGFNAYAYCSGDPVNLVDPNGRFAFPRVTPRPSTRPPYSVTRAGNIHMSGKSRTFTTAPQASSTSTTSTSETTSPFKLFLNNERFTTHSQRMGWNAEDATHRPPHVRIKMISTAEDLSAIPDQQTLETIVPHYYRTPPSMHFIYTPKGGLYTSSAGHQYLSDLTGNPAVRAAGGITKLGRNKFSIINDSGHFQSDYDSLLPVKEHLERLGAQVEMIRFKQLRK